MKPINIKFIPHSLQRYPTLGDYWETENSLEIRISECENPLHSCALLIHELVEMFLVRRDRITFKEIDEFDITYSGPFDAPGDDPQAPYYPQHLRATKCEAFFIKISQENWKDYIAACTELEEKSNPKTSNP